MKKNKMAQALGRLRWKGISERQRSKMVPRNGGRPRLYPQCTRYPNHRFKDDVCKCGFSRKD